MSEKEEADQHTLLWNEVGQSFMKLISQLYSYGYETVVVSVGRDQFSLGSDAGQMYLSCRDIPGDFLQFCTGRRYGQENDFQPPASDVYSEPVLPADTVPVSVPEVKVPPVQQDSSAELNGQLVAINERAFNDLNLSDELNPHQDTLIVKEEKSVTEEESSAASDVASGDQCRSRSDCASAQSDQDLHCSPVSDECSEPVLPEYTVHASAPETNGTANDDPVATRPRRSSTRVRKTSVISNSCDNVTVASGKHASFSCNICGQKFQHRWQKSNHMKSHIYKYECMVDGCDSKFHCKRKFQRHAKFGHGSGSGSSCGICSQRFDCESGLLSHIKYKHKTGRPWKCDKCEATFPCKFRLKSHTNTHNKEKRHVCEICGKSYRTIYKHMMWHRDGKKFKCDVCGHAYLAKESLQSHIVKMSHYSTTQTASAVGCSQCEVCGLKLVGGYKLKRHMRVHNKDLKVLQCSYCSKQFSEKYNLRVHERIHTGNKPTCDICGIVFTSNRKLQEHIKEKHSSVS